MTVREATLKSLQGCTLTKQPGRPTHKGVAFTRHELSKIYARAKTSHKAFRLGSKFGFTAAVIKTKKYIEIHSVYNTQSANFCSLTHPENGQIRSFSPKPNFYTK